MHIKYRREKGEEKNLRNRVTESGERWWESEGDCFNLPVGIFALPVIPFRLFEKLFSEKTVKMYSEQSLSPVGSERTCLVVLTVTPSTTTLPLFIMVMI